MSRETIFALSTVPGRSGVAVVRISGPDALTGAARLAGGQNTTPDRVARLRSVIDPETGDVIDQALIIAFAGPRSFSGEDMVEIHCHGGRAVVDSVLQCLNALPGHRPAAPGEFTRRAFDNGKLDLTEVEGLADLIDAETAAQHRQALRQMDGALGRLYEGWRHKLARALAHVEADLDFPDEDLPDGVGDAVRPVIVGVSADIGAHLADARRGERVRSGIQIAVLGRPNAGKSSLVNALAQRDAAIVSAVAGTTRDVIEVHLDLAGYSVVVADTAGMRDTGDEVELEGVRRARRRAESADIRILVVDAADLYPGAATDDATAGGPGPLPADLAELITPDTLLVINKVDRLRGRPDTPSYSCPVVMTSITSCDGLSELIGHLVAMVTDRLGADGGPPLTRVRHREALMACVEALDRAMVAPLPELFAEDVRLAVRSLGRITGRVDVEDILDIIFRDFCIGK